MSENIVSFWTLYSILGVVGKATMMWKQQGTILNVVAFWHEATNTKK